MQLRCLNPILHVGGAYTDLETTVENMKQAVLYRKHPEAEKVKAYEHLFNKYKALHDLLGRENPTLSYI